MASLFHRTGISEVGRIACTWSKDYDSTKIMNYYGLNSGTGEYTNLGVAPTNNYPFGVSGNTVYYKINGGCNTTYKIYLCVSP